MSIFTNQVAILTFQLHWNILTIYPWFKQLRRVLCGQIVGRSKSTQTQHLKCLPFNGIVHTREIITISSAQSLEPNISTLESDSNEPTIQYGFGRQITIVPPRLKYLNLSPNPLIVLATMAVVQPTTQPSKEKDGSLSPLKSEISSISTPPMNINGIERWETSSDGNFCSDDGARRI